MAHEVVGPGETLACPQCGGNHIRCSSLAWVSQDVTIENERITYGIYESEDVEFLPSAETTESYVCAECGHSCPFLAPFIAREEAV